MKKPIILVTNDDGITANGIKALVEIVKKIGTPIVVAPDSPQSGQGHAITINEPLRIYEVDIFEGVEAYECSGTPVDCVKLAKNVIFKDLEIDLCVSGINHGSNASINILYSGTMSAAMEASLEGIPAIGFSLLNFDAKAEFGFGADYVHRIIEFMLGYNRSEENPMLLNVNIPYLKPEYIKGIKVCRQAEGTWKEDFQEGRDPKGQLYYWLSGKFECTDEGEDTDIYALKNGYLSVVPSSHDLTDYQSLKNLKEMNNL